MDLDKQTEPLRVTRDRQMFHRFRRHHQTLRILSVFSVISSSHLQKVKKKIADLKWVGEDCALFFVEDNPAIVEKYDCFRCFTTQRRYGRRRDASSQQLGLLVGIHLVSKSTTG